MAFQIFLLEQAEIDLLFFQRTYPILVRKIQRLIYDACETPFEGLGKPEPLKHELSGWWSRRINQEHRMVYRLVDDVIEVAQLRSHY